MHTSINKPSRALRAYSLMEVLVVITVVNITAAVLAPVFVSAQEQARQATCASNLKQLGTAFYQYEQDHDQTLPCGYNDVQSTANSSPQFGRGWAARIYPYAKGYDVFHCPDDPTAATAFQQPVSYGMNTNVEFDPHAGGPTYKVEKVSAFAKPSVTVLLFEEQNCLVWFTNSTGENDSPVGLGFCGWTGSGSTISSMSDTLAWQAANPGAQCIADGLWSTGATKSTLYAGAVHGGGANYLLADGHVRWDTPDKVSVGFASNINNGQPSNAVPTSNLGTFDITWSLL